MPPTSPVKAITPNGMVKTWKRPATATYLRGPKATRRFWIAADRYERANGATYREIEIAHCRASSIPINGKPWSRTSSGKSSGAARPPMGDPQSGAALAGDEQPHAHLMYSERTVDGIERGTRAIFQTVQREHPELGAAGKTAPARKNDCWKPGNGGPRYKRPPPTARPRGAGRSSGLADQGIDRAPEQHLGGRQVRQLAPDQREALLERREPKTNSSTASGRWPSSTSRNTSIALTAAAQQREQAEQAARMAKARAYCQQTLDAFRAELAQKAEQSGPGSRAGAPTAARGRAGAPATARTGTGTAFGATSRPSDRFPSVRGTLANRPCRDDGADPSATRGSLRPRNRHRHGRKGFDMEP